MPASYRSTAYGAHRSFRSRAVSAGLAALVVLAILLALLTLGVLPDRLSKPEDILATFDVRPQARIESKGARTLAKAKPVARRSPPPPAAAPPPPLPPALKPKMLVLSSAEFAAADIGKMARDPGTGTANAVETADSGSVYGPGDGPGGQRLFNAEWFREPTRAEMITYMPSGAREGWGMIACRTVERNRVEDCRQIGESPGSGIARGLRQASWQFLVRPPRINGRPVIGAWVRIRFDLVKGVGP